MTNYIDGPSLLQARDKHNHRHFHSFQNSRSTHDDRTERAEPETHIRSPPEHQLQARQGPIVVVHTVVHIIDETGALVQQSTLLPEPVLEIPNPAAVVTAGLGEVDDLVDGITNGVLPTPIDPLGTPTSSASESLLSTETLTSAPSTSTGFPLLSTGISNSTHYGNSTGLFLNTTRTSTARSKSSSSSPTLLTSFMNVPTETAGGAGGNLDANGVAGGAPTAPTTSPPAPPTSSGLTPAAQGAVIGGVVGSVAGIALVALVLMFLLKWNRGNRKGLLLLSDGDEKGGRRSLFAGSRPPGGGAGTQSTPFAIPSTLAALTGPRRAIEAGPNDAAEKGFYRVSGKRLRPVLESGGDGYSDPDPRHSAMSGVSDYRRSEAFVGGSMEQLQLGSPMRPVSGVPIFRSGPNRTPIAATGPFSDYFQRPETPPTPMDPLGRSITASSSQQPRGSPSRFAEGT